MKEYLREIVQRAAPRDALNFMREYLQARILEGLQESGAWASLAFMGGTSLRFLYRLPRFSQGLLKNQSLPDPGWAVVNLIQNIALIPTLGMAGGFGSHWHILLRVGMSSGVVVSSGKDCLATLEQRHILSAAGKPRSLTLGKCGFSGKARWVLCSTGAFGACLLYTSPSPRD